MADEVRLIDANALHKEITSFDHSVIYKDWVQSAIASAPTISDVAPVVHAKWVFNGICTSCSACGSNKPTKAHDHKLASREVRFCYFCGAKMDLEG